MKPESCQFCSKEIDKNAPVTAYTGGKPTHSACLLGSRIGINKMDNPTNSTETNQNVFSQAVSADELTELANRFSHHPPKGDQAERYERIRQAAFEFAVVVKQNTPKSADQTVAIRQIQLAMMLANSTIACNE